MSDRVDAVDVAAVLARGAVGALPLIGPLVSEVLGTIIPGQRLDRIAHLVRILESRLVGVEEAVRARRFVEPGFLDLFEDGLYQAARAVSPERLQQIAALLKNGLTDEDGRASRYKRLLDLLGQLNDGEVVLLQSFSRAAQRDPAFVERHALLSDPPRANIGSSQQEVDDAVMYGASLAHLERLRLIRRCFQHPRKGEAPQFDEKTGTLKASGQELTPLGGLLLRTLDLPV